MRRLLSSARVGRLATVTAAAKPHVVPCCFVVDGDRVYSPVDDVKPKSTLALRRLSNLKENPAAALLVDHYDDDWSQLWWIRVEGKGSVLEDDQERERALAALGDKYEQYHERPPPGPVIAIQIQEWRGWP